MACSRLRSRGGRRCGSMATAKACRPTARPAQCAPCFSSRRPWRLCLTGSHGLSGAQATPGASESELGSRCSWVDRVVCVNDEDAAQGVLIVAALHRLLIEVDELELGDELDPHRFVEALDRALADADHDGLRRGEMLLLDPPPRERATWFLNVRADERRGARQIRIGLGGLEERPPAGVLREIFASNWL